MSNWRAALDDGDKLRLQAFVDTLSNDRFVSYGFPGSYRTQIGEARARYDFKRDGFDGRLTSQTVAGASYRYVHAIGKESFNSGVIALDRRDISQGPRRQRHYRFAFQHRSARHSWRWAGKMTSAATPPMPALFVTSDIAWDHGLDLTLGGRYDAYNVRSVDLGVLPYEPGSGQGGKGSLTYSASLSYKTDFGLVPYVTNAKSSAIEIGQASQVMTSLLAANDWLSASFLNEAGVKFAFLDDHLVGSLAWYRQQRTQLQQSLGSVTRDGHARPGRRGGNPRRAGSEFQLHPGGQHAAHHRQEPAQQFPVYSRPHRRRVAATRVWRRLCHV